MINIIEIIAIGLVGFLVGNCAGDAHTTIDCASKGRAKMLSGGAITCTVERKVNE